MITSSQYFGPFWEHPDATLEKKMAAEKMLASVNALRAEAAADGVKFEVNPNTGNFISGNGHGGFRPEDCPIGADHSTHKDGRGVDNHDPLRRFAYWCRHHEDRLKEHGLYMEREEWTPTWVHLQNVPPRSGKIAYIPSSAPPLASALV
jgi:hypothetical protein